jgi:hypothetical protein
VGRPVGDRGTTTILLSVMAEPPRWLTNQRIGQLRIKQSPINIDQELPVGRVT